MTKRCYKIFYDIFSKSHLHYSKCHNKFKIVSQLMEFILDSVFYGIIFNDSLGQKAVLFADKGYGSLFYGNVVDMLHFPIYKGYFPEWFPFVGGHYFTFFNPVFNVADVAISTGVGLLILCNMGHKRSKNPSFRIDKSDLV